MVVLKFERPAAPAPAKPTKAGKKTWRHPTKEYVRAEAAYEEEPHNGGANVYTAYLKLYGRYPSPEQARAMGLKLGRRVRADDGKMYPPKSKAEKQHDKEVRERQKEYHRILEGVLNVQCALQSLVGIKAGADEIVAYCVRDGAFFHDDAAIERDVDKALAWLHGFAAEWRRRYPIKQDV